MTGIEEGFFAAAALFAAKVVISTAISFVISSVFAKKPKTSTSATEAQDRLITIRQPAAAGRVIFGRVRAGGVFDLVHSSTYTQNNYAIRTEDAVISSGAPFYVSAVVVETISAVTRTWNPQTEQYDDTELIAGSGTPAPGEYVFDDGGGSTPSYAFNSADNGKAIRITHRYIASTTVSKFLHLVIELACHEVAEIGDIYFDDELIPLDADGFATGRLAGGFAYVSKHLGTDDQEADAQLMFYAPDVWTPDHRLRGRAYIYVRLWRELGRFPTGMPNITAIVKGYKPYDPRTGLSVWSSNWALCMAAYLTDPVFGLAHDYDDEIDEPLLITAANISDEGVALASGGFEARYTCNGSFLTSEAPKDILGRMKVAGSGSLVRIGGKWRIYAGAYITPTVTLTQDDLRGPVQLRPRLSRRDLFNGVKGVYVSEANAWQPSDFPAVTNELYLEEDNGERIWLDMDLQYTTFAPTAQRLAKIELERVRQQITVVMPCKLSAYVLEPPRTVMLTLPQFGWTSKVFEVAQLDLVADVDENQAPYVGVDLTLRETAAAVWDWNSGEETTVDPAPDTNLPNPFDVAPPGIPTVREEFYESAGNVFVRLQVDWAPSGDGQANSYDVEWKRIEDTQFQQHPQRNGTHDVIENVSAGFYDVRVRARATLVTSAWAQARFEVLGFSQPIDTPFIEGLQAVGGLAVLSLEPHPDIRVRVGGRWRIRHSETMDDPSWEESFSIGQEQGYPGANTIIVLPLKPGSYLVKAEDAGGRQSESFDWIATKQATVLAYSTLATVTEDPDFLGAHDGTVASSGILKLDAAGTIDDVADWDSIVRIDALGGILDDGTYNFASGTDFGAGPLKRVRITSQIEGITVNEFDLIDQRGENIDTWLSFDGNSGGGSTDAWIEFRQTDDDPAGTPTWSDWLRLDSCEVVCRALEYRARVISNDLSYNQHIDTLRVKVEELA